jgi:hypothetical protein
MLFNTFQFAIFFCFVLVLYWGSPPRARASVLLAASLVFYTLWIPVYLLLLLANLGINYALLRLMVRSGRPRPYLVASVVTTLAMLGYFKYAAMLVESLLPILSAFSIFPEPPELFLPLGISFYSFQIIALSVDTYRGHIEPVKSFSRYALFISFFPQLIAGPILRGYQFLPQLEAGGRWATERTRRGLWLLASGLIKKVIFADFLLAPFVDEAYAVPQAGSGPFFLVATYSFAFQIYFDFSGYTDMARGLACLLGFEIPSNFREPYLSRSPSEFWRRLAHHPVALAPGLPLHPPRRQSAGRPAHPSQSSDHDASRGALARSRLDLRSLGRATRNPARALSRPRRNSDRHGRPALAAGRTPDPSLLSPHLPAVGLLSRRIPLRCDPRPRPPLLSQLSAALAPHASRDRGGLRNAARRGACGPRETAPNPEPIRRERLGTLRRGDHTRLPRRDGDRGFRGRRRVHLLPVLAGWRRARQGPAA